MSCRWSARWLLGYVVQDMVVVAVAGEGVDHVAKVVEDGEEFGYVG